MGWEGGSVAGSEGYVGVDRVREKTVSVVLVLDLETDLWQSDLAKRATVFLSVDMIEQEGRKKTELILREV